MKYSKYSQLLPALMLCAAAASAATREDMQQLDATQLPGIVSICKGEITLQVNNAHLKSSDLIRTTVISARDAPLRYRVEYSNTLDGVVFMRYEYEMTS